MHKIRVAVTVFMIVTVGLIMIELARGSRLSESITLAVCCGVGTALGTALGLTIKENRQMSRLPRGKDE
jgi:hypothetical protein